MLGKRLDTTSQVYWILDRSLVLWKRFQLFDLRVMTEDFWLPSPGVRKCLAKSKYLDIFLFGVIIILIMMDGRADWRKSDFGAINVLWKELDRLIRGEWWQKILIDFHHLGFLNVWKIQNNMKNESAEIEHLTHLTKTTKGLPRPNKSRASVILPRHMASSTHKEAVAAGASIDIHNQTENKLQSSTSWSGRPTVPSPFYPIWASRDYGDSVVSFEFVLRRFQLALRSAEVSHGPRTTRISKDRWGIGRRILWIGLKHNPDTGWLIWYWCRFSTPKSVMNWSQGSRLKFVRAERI